MKRLSLLSASLVAICAAFSAAAVAQTYPDKPVRLIVPASPGGGLDVLSRLVAGKLSGYWAQQMIIDNRPGAGMAIGTAAAAKSPADGHTLRFGYQSLLLKPVVASRMTVMCRDLSP